MFSVNEIIQKGQVGFVSIKGYFYVLGGRDIRAFISDSKKIKDGEPIITLPSDLVDTIISQDEILGVMVGGRYLYCAIPIEIEGVVDYKDKSVFFVSVNKLVLFSEDSTQEFII